MSLLHLGCGALTEYVIAIYNLGREAKDLPLVNYKDDQVWEAVPLKLLLDKITESRDAKKYIMI
jgi:hypothetical protein